MAIYVVTGRPRHGKTYFVSRVIVKLLKKKERVFSNIKINLGIGALKKFNDDIVGDLAKSEDRENPEKLLFYWRNIHEWNHMDKGTIIADEATRYLNPRAWSQLSEDTETKLQQHGKDDLDIWMTVQHFSRIDVTARLMVERFYNVETIFGRPRKKNKPPLFGLKIFRIEDMILEDIPDWEYVKKRPDSQEKIVLDVGSQIMFFRKKYAIIYDTRQKVGRSEPMPLVHKVRTCSICGYEATTHA